MNRRLCSLIALPLLLSSTLAAQEPAMAPAIDSLQLTDNIYMLTGQGGNLGLSVGPEGTFLIDDQYAPMHDAIVSAIAEITGSDQGSDRVFLLNTHFHADHTGGNELLGESGAVILAHENVRSRLTVEQVVPFFDMRVPALKPEGLPVLTFTRDVTLHLNGDQVEIQYIGGTAHTDGDSIVFFRQANVLHTGDLVFIGTYPFIDLDNGGSVAGVIAAVDRLITLVDDETRIIPGHGPLIDKAGLVAYHAMLMTIHSRVTALVAAGRDLEAVRAAQPTAEFDADWSGFIDAGGFVGIVFRDASGLTGD